MCVTWLTVEQSGLEGNGLSERVLEALVVIANGHRRLETVVGHLEGLADDLHIGDRRARARDILDFLATELPRIVKHEGRIIAAVERQRHGNVEEAGLLHELRKEHAVLQDLLVPVAKGLEEIGAIEQCADPAGFTLSALVVCEFLRMHVRYLQAALLSLVKEGGDLAALSQDTASEQGCNPKAPPCPMCLCPLGRSEWPFMRFPRYIPKAHAAPGSSSL